MRWPLAVGLLLSTALTLTAQQRTAAGGEALQEGKIRVLLVTGGHGFQQEPFFALFDAIADAKITKAVYPDVAELFEPQLAKHYDVLVFYDMWKEGITPSQQEGLVKLLESGIGVVALHHTLGAHGNWPQYAKIIGGKYHLKDRVVDGKTIPKSTYSHGEDIQVAVVDPDHPITRGVKSFQIHDETYSGYDTHADVKVLLGTDHPKSDPELAWVKTYGNSRVFCLLLGHDSHAYQHSTYQLLVARGIRWAAGRRSDPQAPTTALFNGQDLSGWEPEGDARWEVKDGQLIGRQGADNAPGDLFSRESFTDFELEVVLKVVWPANTGVWFRYQSARQAYQADVLEYKKPFALSGSLYCAGKMFLAINTDAKLVNREGWNRFVIRSVGNRQVVFLNGTKVADVRDDSSDRGRIGFQIHAGEQFGDMQVIVKEIRIREI